MRLSVVKGFILEARSCHARIAFHRKGGLRTEFSDCCSITALQVDRDGSPKEKQWIVLSFV